MQFATCLFDYTSVNYTLAFKSTTTSTDPYITITLVTICPLDIDGFILILINPHYTLHCVINPAMYVFFSLFAEAPSDSNLILIIVFSLLGGILFITLIVLAIRLWFVRYVHQLYFKRMIRICHRCH